MTISSSTVEQPHQVLLTAKNRLEYLTANDWALISDKSQRVSFSKDEILINAGRVPRRIFLILSGTARIESSAGKRIAQIGRGDICGEMSFLEGTVASASVVADAPLDALVIDQGTLLQLFELYPHLGSRFYHSLALKLSRRLRGQLSSGEATHRK
jgi:CRP-like cAMP-binding protein